MTKRSLLVIAAVTAVISFFIIIGANYLVRGKLSSRDIINCAVVALASGVGLFFAFLGQLGKKRC